MGVENADTQPIEIEDSSAWASTINKTVTNESAIESQNTIAESSSGCTEKEDSSSVWRHSAEEIRAKRAASSYETDLF